MKKYVLATFLALFLLSCNTNKERENTEETINHAHLHEEQKPNELNKGIMAIHDSIMPAMGSLMDLQKKISVEIKNMDSLLAVKSSDILKERKEKALLLHTQLEKADQEMMNWMHQYKADTLNKMDKEHVAAYITDQTQKIEAVRDLTHKSISEAQIFIQKK
ncbi:hypothetical protein [Dyadobacter sp. NIV53]|uniref:hypothetical protein n=1 Tax=Dyadobacter sp. NIV53 TaxID=2861765 RepID=UPI001C86C325|nr:hypothetical protein [Dyadobacter sp. NIV53]